MNDRPENDDLTHDRPVQDRPPHDKPLHERPSRPVHAFRNQGFLDSRDGRTLRILSEYLEPDSRFRYHRINDTIVFMGSARTVSREQAEAEVEAAEAGHGDLERARQRLRMSTYYEASRELARRLTEWSKHLEKKDRRFVVCTGGGGGIMEAANRGAAEAKGLNVGLGIAIPFEEFDNPFVSRQLNFHFHYFFMRKFWFAYLAKAVVFFPGGFGTLDELFELLTLRQTHKMRKHLPVVLFGKDYWDEVVDFDALVRHGSIDAGDLDFFYRTDSVDDAFDYVTRELAAYALGTPGATL